MDKKIVKVAAQTGFVFGLLGWLYVIAMQIAHPESVTWTLVWWSSLRLDQFGEFCFVVAIAAFFVWRFVHEKEKK